MLYCSWIFFNTLLLNTTLLQTAYVVHTLAKHNDPPTQNDDEGTHFERRGEDLNVCRQPRTVRVQDSNRHCIS